MLYKVKLMKMLWYADSLSYKIYGHSMTGLVYCHEGMGALPIGHYKIGGLQLVNMEEECDYEEILDKVIEKFKGYTASQISEYMHDEVAYKKTNDKEIIPFSLAKQIRDF